MVRLAKGTPGRGQTRTSQATAKKATVMLGSAAMIRMPLHDGDGAIELLGQHDAYEAMGKRHAAQRKLEMRRLFERIAMAVRPADREGDIERFIAQPREHGGEFVGGEHLPLLVERDEARAAHL